VARVRPAAPPAPGSGGPAGPERSGGGLARWLAAARVYRLLAAASLRGRVSHPAGFALRTLGTGLLVATEVVGVVLAVRRFGTLAGWTAPQVVLLVGLGAAGQGLGLALGDRLEPAFFSELVRKGTFDQVLTRPTSPLGWMVASYLEVRFVGRVLVGAGVVAWAASRAGVAWTPSHLLVAATAVACCAALVLAISVLGGALTLYTVEGSEVVNIFTYGGVALSCYPMEIYGPALRAVFTWMVPFALAVYVPGLVLLGRTGPPGLPAGLLWATPAVTAAFAGLAGLGWRAGVRHYTGTGS
jgi:ABC-2 type transport system permease protein